MTAQRYAEVISGTVAQIVELPQDPTALFHGDLASRFVTCGSDVQPMWTYDGANFAAPVSVVQPLASLQNGLCADIDAQASTQRGLYISSGTGQDATYLLKQTQAVQALAAQAGADNGKSADQLAQTYPYLSNEIGITVDPSSNAPATDIYGVARSVMAVLQVWQPINLKIEATRLKTKAAINAATTAVAAHAAHDAAVWPRAS